VAGAVVTGWIEDVPTRIRRLLGALSVISPFITRLLPRQSDFSAPHHLSALSRLSSLPWSASLAEAIRGLYLPQILEVNHHDIQSSHDESMLRRLLGIKESRQ
jgi:hypothetical protein